MSSKRKSPPTKLDGACGVSTIDGSLLNGQQQLPASTQQFETSSELEEPSELESLQSSTTASPLFNEPLMDGQSYHNNYQFDSERERQPASKKKRNNQVNNGLFNFLKVKLIKDYLKSSLC